MTRLTLSWAFHTWGERSAHRHDGVLVANDLLCVRSLLTKIRALAPAGFSGSFRSTDAYIKAFYLPWDELSRCAGAGHCQRLFTVSGDKRDALSRCGICGVGVQKSDCPEQPPEGTMPLQQAPPVGVSTGEPSKLYSLAQSSNRMEHWPQAAEGRGLRARVEAVWLRCAAGCNSCHHLSR